MGYIRTFEEKIFCVTKLDLHQNLRTIKFCDFTTRERTGKFGIERLGRGGVRFNKVLVQVNFCDRFKLESQIFTLI